MTAEKYYVKYDPVSLSSVDYTKIRNVAAALEAFADAFVVGKLNETKNAGRILEPLARKLIEIYEPSERDSSEN